MQHFPKNRRGPRPVAARVSTCRCNLLTQPPETTAPIGLTLIPSGRLPALALIKPLTNVPNIKTIHPNFGTRLRCPISTLTESLARASGIGWHRP